MRSFLSCAVLAASLSLSTPLFAQDSAPRSLTPRTLEPISQQPAQPKPVPVQTISGGIDVQTLGAISSESSGTLSSENGFGANMWAGSSRLIIESLIKTLPAKPSAPYLRIMQRRLLLSAAQPPAGQSGPQSLLSLRAEKLLDMGQIDDMIKLINAAPKSEQDDQLKQSLVKGYLLNEKLSDACALTSSEFQANPSGFWVKAMAFCRMMAAQKDQAMLALSLLEESGESDRVFRSLMQAQYGNERGLIEELNTPSALHLALIKANKSQISEAARNTDDPNFMNFLTKAGDIKAIYKAVELNLASVDFLREAYLREKFDQNILDDALAQAITLPAYQAQALLYQVTAQEGQLNVVMTETISLALDLAQKQGNIFATSRLYAPFIAKLARSIDLLWFAPDAMRSLLAAGDWENAKAWYLMLRNAAFTDPEAAKNWTNIRPLAVFAGFDVADEAVKQALEKWWQAQPEEPASYEKSAYVFALTDGLGHDVPDQLWLDLINGPQLENATSAKPALRIKMIKAALASRVGETVLAILNAIGTHSFSEMNQSFIRDSLFALRTVGLERDARAIAVETALQAGL